MNNKNILISPLIFMSLMIGTIVIAQNEKVKPRFSTIIDAKKGDEMMAQCSRSVPEKVNGYWNLIDQDKDFLEANLNKIKQVDAFDSELSGNKIKNLNKFGYQYIGVTIEGRKYIYINAFWIESSAELRRWYDEWKVEPVTVCDGGESFWSALFDMETLEFSQLSFNGVS